MPRILAAGTLRAARAHSSRRCADVQRTHSLYYEDQVILQAAFSREEAPHHIICRPPMLARLVDNLRGTDEISLVASLSKATFQSFHSLGDSSTGTSWSVPRTDACASSLRGALPCTHTRTSVLGACAQPWALLRVQCLARCTQPCPCPPLKSMRTT
ncbi:hypothetical protein EON67_00765 [archaeon]|nr:MAG: hypothetical protein EON67_00765 [archaeon]